MYSLFRRSSGGCNNTSSSGSGNGSSSSPYSAAINAAIRKLQELQINFLAIDFDQTMIDIHTAGRWRGSIDELQEHVRPEFQQLLKACQHADIHVAVVTFSQQAALIKSLLERVVGEEYAARIPVRGEDRSWTYAGEGSREGKQAHIASAVEELEQMPVIMSTTAAAATSENNNNNNQEQPQQQQPAQSSEPQQQTFPKMIEITKRSTLLIDDDTRNIRHALQDGVRAVWFNPDKPHHLLRDLARLV